MAVLNGNELILVANTASLIDVEFVAALNHSVNVSVDMIPVTTEDTNGWIEYTPNIKTSSIDFSGLIDFNPGNTINVEELLNRIFNSNDIVFKIGAGDDNLAGKGYITNVSLTGEADNPASYSGTLIVTEELTINNRVTEHLLQDTDGEFILTTGGDTITVYIP